MFKSFENIYQFVLISVLVFWMLIVLGLSLYIGSLFIVEEKWYIPLFLFGFIFGITIGIYFYVILSIPFLLAKAFDPIKNKIARKEFKSVDDFQKEIAEFCIRFFRFPGCNITGIYSHLIHSGKLSINFSDTFDESLFSSKEKIIGPNRISGEKLIYIPIRFGQNNLGFIILKMHGFVLSFFPWLFNDFVKNYLDDQYVIVLSQHKIDLY